MADTEHEATDDKRCTLFDGPRRFCQRCSEFHTEAEWMDTCERYLGGEPIRKCKTCGGDHPLDRWPGNCMPEPNWNRSELASPFIISDNLEVIGGLNGVQSMADGKFYTSKARMRADYRARGLIEMGNDRPPQFKKPRPDRKAIKEAVGKAISAVENGARVENFVKQRKAAPTMGRFAS